MKASQVRNKVIKPIICKLQIKDEEIKHLEPGSEYSASTLTGLTNIMNNQKLEIVIHEFLESYVPPNDSFYVILYFQYRNFLTKIFKDRVRKL